MGSIHLTESEILDHIKECWRVSNNHWETYEKAKWDQSWQLYENKGDYSKKKAWQDKSLIPKTEANVDTTRDLIRRGLTSVKKWFGHEGVEEQDKKLAPQVTHIVRWWADSIKVIETIMSAVKTALICSVGIIKSYETTYTKWEGGRTLSEEGISGYEWEPIEAWKPVIDEVDPYDVRFSRDMEIYEGKPRGTYIIERKEMELTELVLSAGTMGYKKVSKVKSSDFPKDAEAQKGARDQTEEPASDVIHPVEIKEYHGYMRIHPDKKVGGDKQKGQKRYFFEEELKYVITIANDKTLLRVSGQNKEEYSYPNPNQDYIYYIIRPMPRNFRFYGKSLVESLASLQTMLNDIWNANFDNFWWTVHKLFGIDDDAIVDKDDLKVEPGNFIRLQSGGKINDAIQNLLVGDLPRSSMEIPMAIEMMMDRHSGVTPQVQSGLSQPGAETATEFQGLMQQSALKFEGMAKNIEEPIISIVGGLTHTILTTDNEFAWSVADKILGDKAPLITSLMSLSGEYDIKSTGITSYVDKMQTSNKLIALLNTLLPVIQLGINVRPIIKGILRANEDVVGEVDEVFPDVPTYDINTIMAILGQIDPALPQMFQQALQELQAAKGGGPSGMRSEAQPSTGGMNATAFNPETWAAGGGSQG